MAFELLASGITEKEFIHENLLPESQYRYYVTAVGCGDDESFPSNTVTGNTECSTAPPTNLYVNETTLTFSSVELIWTAGNDSTTFYKIYRAIHIDNVNIPLNTYTLIGTTVDTTFTDTSVEDNTEYRYYVTAVACSNEVESSPTNNDVINVIVPPAPCSFDPVNTLTGVSNVTREVFLDWDHNSLNITSYIIYMKKQSETTFRRLSVISSLLYPIDTVAPPTSSFNVRFLDANETYNFKIVAVGCVPEQQVDSNIVTVLVLEEPCYVNIPTNLRIGTVTNNSVQILWDSDGLNVNSFDIYTGATATGVYELLTNVSFSSRSYTHSTTNYVYYKIKAKGCTPLIESDFSNRTELFTIQFIGNTTSEQVDDGNQVELNTRIILRFNPSAPNNTYLANISMTLTYGYSTFDNSIIDNTVILSSNSFPTINEPYNTPNNTYPSPIVFNMNTTDTIIDLTVIRGNNVIFGESRATLTLDSVSLTNGNGLIRIGLLNTVSTVVTIS